MPLLEFLRFFYNGRIDPKPMLIPATEMVSLKPNHYQSQCMPPEIFRDYHGSMPGSISRLLLNHLLDFDVETIHE